MTKRLTKSNFLSYLDAPMHLWAELSNKFDKPLSLFDQHLMTQGYKVEKLAHEYLEKLAANDSKLALIWQRNFLDGKYEATSDALIHHQDTDTYDIYEIKSSSEVKKENKYDATFQFLVTNKQIKVDKIYILHLNKDYVRYGRLNIDELFTAEDVTDIVHEMKIDVDIEREKAAQILDIANPDSIQGCYSINSCRCLSLCHPNLPSFSIFHIPSLSKKKKQELLDLSITQAKDVPDNISLSYKQSQVVKAAKTNQLIIDQNAVSKQLSELQYPLHFLDYETFNPAVPQFDGYHPHQHMVFQYSLHIQEHPQSEITHFEHLSLETDDPAKSLIKNLHDVFEKTGSVIVWNKTFESGRNKEMAELYPEYYNFLVDLNKRMYDLADFVKNGIFVHPDFKGSWSIKAVLPVLASELSYKNLEIGKGDQAMLTWWETVHEHNSQSRNNEHIAQALLEYCKLDTWAMVKILKAIRNFELI